VHILLAVATSTIITDRYEHTRIVDIEAERRMDRSDVAEYLRSFADELDARGGRDTDGTRRDDRSTDSHRGDDAVSGDNTNTDRDSETTDGSDGSGTTDSTDATDGSDNTDTSTNEANGETTGDDYATDVEQRNRENLNRDESDRSDGSSGSGRSTELGGSGGRVTFMIGNESTTINPPEEVTFEVIVDSESALIGTGTGRTARFALHWNESDIIGDEGLSIQ
jgi:hypothetical protein